MLKKLGAGGIGEIYLVEDQQGRQLALKLSTDMISITKEYQFLTKFKDKAFIPKIYDLDDFQRQDKTYHFFTMEYIQGYNLKTAMKDHALNIATKINLVRIITSIIVEINQAGYVYSDLKHENIMIDGRNKLVRLIDLGSLVELNSTVKEYTPMYDRLCWGRGKRIADKQYQIFVIAMLLISLMLNRTLDPAKEKLDTAMLALRKKQIPKGLVDILSRCLEGKILDCHILYNEISCAAEKPLYPDRLKTALNALILMLFVLLTGTIFAFCQ